MPSSAEAFFAELFGQTDPFSFLVGLTKSAPPTFETEWLDFKGDCGPKDILKTWSEAVSGFANTEGGVLIWGIDCRKTDGVDAACGVALIENPVALKSLLLTNINQTTDPPVQGILLREIVGFDGKGFLVCLVPESTNKPHRAEQKTNKPYMIRAGDSFVVPSPSLLRSMFYPRVSPDIQIEIAAAWERTRPEPPIPSHGLFRFEIRLWNVGQATAHDLVVEFRARAKGELVPGSEQWRKSQTVYGVDSLEFLKPLHPNMPARFFFDAQLPAAMNSAVRCFEPDSPVSFRALTYARDMECRHLFADFTRNEVADRETKKAIIGTPNPSW